jgi:hypothetical protein
VGCLWCVFHYSWLLNNAQNKRPIAQCGFQTNKEAQCSSHAESFTFLQSERRKWMLKNIYWLWKISNPRPLPYKSPGPPLLKYYLTHRTLLVGSYDKNQCN